MTEPVVSALQHLLPRPRSTELHDGFADPATPVRTEISSDLQPQAYQLTIAQSQTTLTAGDESGLFYGRQTLRQLATLFPNALPRMEINDHPDFPVRGVMLDISRDKVPTMPTLKSIVDQLAGLKINQLQLYTEHTFAYRNHETVWQHASPMTAAEIRELDAYCLERFIELVPNQNSLGHMERWLKHESYLPLAESPDGSQTPWGGRWEGPYSLCPTDPRSLSLLGEMYAELLPNFSSKLFNVGCDETFDIGQPGTRSEAICQQRGAKNVYLDFLKQIHALCGQHGRRMMFWGDIIMESPELAAELPKDAIALEWGYEADHPFDEHQQHFKRAGLDFYVCPGTSSWLSFAGRTTNALANLRSAAESGLRNGAIGYLNTDWGDWGHLQYWPISAIPIAYGAGVSWCLDQNRDEEMWPAVDFHVFGSSGLAHQLFLLGNVYTLRDPALKPLKNGTLLFRILQQPASPRPPILEGVEPGDLFRQLEVLDAMFRSAESSSLRCDALHRDELRNTIRMMIHAARRGLWLLGNTGRTPEQLWQEMETIIAEHERLWLSRNRVGGLSDSVARLRQRQQEYR